MSQIMFSQAPKLGAIMESVINDAREAGLDAVGLAAMRSGDRAAYRAALRRLDRAVPGSIWACTTGFSILYNSSPESERRADIRRAERQLRLVAQSPCAGPVATQEEVDRLHDRLCAVE